MIRPTQRLLHLIAVASSTVIVVTGCGSQTPSGTGTQGSVSEAAGAFQPPTVEVFPRDKADYIRLDAPVTVRSGGGRLDAVSVHAAGDSNQLTGHLSANHRAWNSADTLDPRTQYVVDVTATSPGGDTTSSRTTFSTMNVDRLTTTSTPSDGDTVGVGMPIKLRFNADVPSEKQADFVSHITVSSTPAVTGAWRWFAPNEVHWRPQDYWPTGTKVTVAAKLKGLEAGDNFWGLANWTSAFNIGPKHVSMADTASHQMQVFENDQLVQSWPISAGRPGRETIGGTLVVLYKTPDVLMDSLSIGIPRTSPDGYYDHVFWDTAISTNGFFVHAAPWSEGSQGTDNVSHGCVNLSPDRAKQFFDFSQIGDIVVVKNSPRIADSGDGEGDWQVPFEQYANSGGTISVPAAHNAPGGV